MRSARPGPALWSIRPIELPVVEYLERRRVNDVGTYVFPAQEDNAFGSFPNHWKHIFEDSVLSDVTPHVLRIASRASPTISVLPR
jgi:hypothetical protein